MATTATVNSRGQITIPVEIRTSLGLHPGSRVDFVETSRGSFEVRPVGTSVRALRGMLDRPERPVTIEEMNNAIAEGAVDGGSSGSGWTPTSSCDF